MISRSYERSSGEENGNDSFPDHDFRGDASGYVAAAAAITRRSSPGTVYRNSTRVSARYDHDNNGEEDPGPTSATAGLEATRKGCYLEKRFCKQFSESSTICLGSRAAVVL